MGNSLGGAKIPRVRKSLVSRGLGRRSVKNNIHRRDAEALRKTNFKVKPREGAEVAEDAEGTTAGLDVTWA